MDTMKAQWSGTSFGQHEKPPRTQQSKPQTCMDSPLLCTILCISCPPRSGLCVAKVRLNFGTIS